MPEENTNEAVSQEGEQSNTQQAPNADLEAARKELELQKQRNEAQRQQYEVFRQQYEQRIQQLQGGYQTTGYQPEQVDSSDAALQQMQQQLNRSNEEMGLMRYKVENPNWQDSWEQVQQIINDPVKAQEVAVFDQTGRPDFARSLTNAQRMVELEELRQAKQKAAEAKATQAQEQDRQKGMATISGVAASEGEEEIDVEKLSAQEMLDKGIIEVDPTDPITDLRQGRR
jgi:hypothetical protein